jgi:hypothetical protein
MLGPRLAALVVILSLHDCLSRTQLRELLKELTGLELSTGLIDQTLCQSAGQVPPLEDVLLEADRELCTFPPIPTESAALNTFHISPVNTSLTQTQQTLARFHVYLANHVLGKVLLISVSLVNIRID